MKKLIKNVLNKLNNHNNENNKLMVASVYLNLYVSTLEEVVKDDGDIYLHESGEIYAKIWIQKKHSKCYVDHYFWKEFSELFSLQDNQVKSIITRWVEDTYKLTGIYTTGVFKSNWSIS